MKTRRIVTGRDDAGNSIVVSDGLPPRAVHLRHVPGFSSTLLWETVPGAHLGGAVSDPTPKTSSWLPSAGGTNVMLVVFPPDALMASPDFDPAAAGAEYMEKLPGLAECFEMDAPGMHTTDSVDYVMVLEGEICLELDREDVRTLKKHDVVVQNGTRHAWRNRSDKPATLLVVLVGAERQLP